ncbi:MAG: hypothetical protein NUV97_01640 [archaeon]|nr:hypothetical protein [archaeon]MCR4323656.1 hypothetical protein [Nanoarchaeota archaeon]
MELKRINYTSAIFAGAIALVMYLVTGLLQTIVVSRLPELQPSLGIPNPLQSLVIIPLVGGIIVYLLTLIVIFVYNLVAQKYPISWKLNK